MKKVFIFLSALIITLNVTAQNPIPDMVLVEGGEFSMGNHESKFLDEYPARKVTLNNFYIAKYEVTVAEYVRFCRMAGLSEPKGSANMPATNVTWFESVMYCNWLSKINGLERCYIITRDAKNISVKYIHQAKGYRLPTEAEWEYAAIGGSKTQNFAYSGSNTPTEIAWFTDSGKQLHEVGKKAPNELGIYDMSGNSYEWCYDYYDNKYYEQKVNDNPLGPKVGTARVCRGGSFLGTTETLRITKRFYNSPDYKTQSLGFRVVRND